MCSHLIRLEPSRTRGHCAHSRRPVSDLCPIARWNGWRHQASSTAIRGQARSITRCTNYPFHKPPRARTSRAQHAAANLQPRNCQIRAYTFKDPCSPRPPLARHPPIYWFPRRCGRRHSGAQRRAPQSDATHRRALSRYSKGLASRQVYFTLAAILVALTPVPFNPCRHVYAQPARV